MSNNAQNFAAQNSTTPTVLVFAGLDPSGGAGIQADIEALASHGCHCCPIVTCLTDQDTINVKTITPVAPELIIRQAKTILADTKISAIKIGLLGQIPLIRELRILMETLPNTPIILDPILSTGGGTTIANAEYIAALITELLPVTNFLTPNYTEAQTLARALGATDNTIETAAQLLLAQQCEYVLITGGDTDTPEVINTLYRQGAAPEIYKWQRLVGQFHGSGCTLASSIAGLVAQNHAPTAAVQEAQEYTWSSLEAAYRTGKGQLIPNRFFWAKMDLSVGRHTQEQL